MLCNGCGNDKAYRVDILGGGEEICDVCGRLPAVWLPDVQVKSGAEYTLPDVNGKPPVFTSRREKATFLRAHNLAEAGDKMQYGNPYVKKYDKGEALSQVRKAMAEVKALGKSGVSNFVRAQFTSLRGK
jgi:hypothetical protein